MKLRYFVTVVALAIFVTGLPLMVPVGTSAHEERTVGEYEVEVGFNEEPALVNQLNGVFLSVMRADVPIEGLDETLQVELIIGGGAAKKQIAFEASEEEPGAYVAAFLPTAVGDYTFRIFGEIEGTAIDEVFESGPGRFDSVESLDEVAFPEAPADVSSLTQSVQDLEAKVDGLDSGGSSADGTARTLGIIGIVVGLIGLGAAGFATMRRGG